MTYVTDQTSAELRSHMRSLKAMHGWNDPLSDRLFKEIQEQDAELRYLRWFFANADFGPADDDVRKIMNQEFISKTGAVVPEEFRQEE